jgi:hypothetical protein
MIIQGTIPVSQNSLWDYAKKITGLPPSPGYITKRRACVNRQGAVHQILILYAFDKSKFPEAMEYICKELRSLRDVCEFSISAHLLGPHPSFLTLGKGGEV